MSLCFEESLVVVFHLSMNIIFCGDLEEANKILTLQNWMDKNEILRLINACLVKCQCAMFILLKKII